MRLPSAVKAKSVIRVLPSPKVFRCAHFLVPVLMSSGSFSTTGWELKRGCGIGRITSSPSTPIVFSSDQTPTLYR